MFRFYKFGCEIIIYFYSVIFLFYFLGCFIRLFGKNDCLGSFGLFGFVYFVYYRLFFYGF